LYIAVYGEETPVGDDERRCESCGQPLSRYNPASECGGCATAARHSAAPLVQVPLGVWFTPMMRRALGQWDWPVVLTVVAKETGAPQTQLAEATGLSQAHVSRLMNGQARCYDIRTINRMVDGLGAPRLLAGLAPAVIDTGASLDRDDVEEVGATHRR